MKRIGRSVSTVSGEGVEIYDWRLDVFVLMRNHDHLFVVSCAIDWTMMLCLVWLVQETGHNGGVLRGRPDDDALPQLIPLQPRLSLATITDTVAAHFGQDASRWQPGRRVDGARRAVAAYLARRRFGYRAGEVAEALGYRTVAQAA